VVSERIALERLPYSAHTSTKLQNGSRPGEAQPPKTYDAVDALTRAEYVVGADGREKMAGTFCAAIVTHEITRASANDGDDGSDGGGARGVGGSGDFGSDDGGGSDAGGTAGRTSDDGGPSDVSSRSAGEIATDGEDDADGDRGGSDDDCRPDGGSHHGGWREYGVIRDNDRTTVGGEKKRKRRRS